MQVRGNFGNSGAGQQGGSTGPGLRTDSPLLPPLRDIDGLERAVQGSLRLPSVAAKGATVVDGSRTAPSPSSPQASDPKELGVNFPSQDGRRGSTTTAKAILSDAAKDVSPSLAQRIRDTHNWRADYVGPCRDLVAEAARSPRHAASIANNGLTSSYEQMVFVTDGGETSIDSAMSAGTGTLFGDVVVTGETAFSGGGFVLPYQGGQLQGSDVRSQARRWAERGVVEPSLVTALSNLEDHPEWLDLRGVHVVLLGAGAEMGPLEHLLRWGADVWAVDLPRPQVWERIIRAVKDTPGRLHIPVPSHRKLPDPQDLKGLAGIAGANLISDTPGIAAWLGDLPDGAVLGTYGYADGGLHVRLSVAADALGQALRRARPNLVLAYLATPTDAFAVPADALAMARDRWEGNKSARFWRLPLKPLQLFQPAFQTTVFNQNGDEVGIADCIVGQQGPNYLLAKRLQRFRAVAARSAGQRVSLNVAPPTRTYSVIKNRALAAAYAGARTFDIEVFEPDTSNALMAALLARDLADPESATSPQVDLANPMDLFGDAANHGGLWRAAYDPRSVLGVAALLGMFEQKA